MPFHDVGSYCCDYKNFPPVFIEFPVINKILTQDLDFWIVDDNIFLNYPLKQYFFMTTCFVIINNSLVLF